MENNHKTVRIKNLYDGLVCFLLVWCVLQDFFLCIVLRITGLTLVVKLLFYSKDIILLVLFLSSIFRKRIPAKFIACCLFYFALVGIHTFVGMDNTSLEITSFFSSIRGLILLPTLTLVGYSIHDKDRFRSFIKRYYWFLVIVAFIGIIEFVADIIKTTSDVVSDFIGWLSGGSTGAENFKAVITGLVTAFMSKYFGGNYQGCGNSVDEPLHTVTAIDHNALAAVHITQFNNHCIGQKADEPLKTITCGEGHFGEVRAFLIKYYSGEGSQNIEEPLHTITTKDRFGLVTIKGVDYAIVDIGLRMLTPRELYNAQGFPSDYEIETD